MLERLKPFLVFAWYWLQLKLHLGWLRVNKWVYNATLAPPSNARYIAVIGDGVAEGVGDWVTLGSNPGLAGHIQATVRRKNPTQVHRAWYALNAGHSGSISYEWSPRCERKPDRGGWLVKRSLYQDFVDHPLLGAADIVFVFLGANDRDHDPVWTVTQVKAVCEALRARGKICYVMGLPNANARAYQGEAACARAIAISRYVRKTQTEPNPVRAGPPLGQGAFATAACRCFYGMHLNSKGYRQLAEVVWESLLQDMTRVEFNLVRGRAPAVDAGTPSAPSAGSRVANPYHAAEGGELTGDGAEQTPVDAAALEAEAGAPELRARG